ncbi:TIGR03086 family metal-binding protein [Kineococcus rhizosphaerae]|nr:TIGR03086 family metal-binding protein [Kineococcus rhizosphaerae]
MDLSPAAGAMAALLRTLSDDDLDRRTPCGGTVAALLTHVGGLTVAFTDAARKDLGPTTSTPPGGEMPDELPPTWRTEFPARLDDLARAWTDPAAWEGATRAGGIDLPAPVAATVAVDELVLHAWDLAVATGRAHVPDDESLAAVEEFVLGIPADPAARQGLFGPPVPVGDDATRFEKVLAHAGRDPRWRA